MQGRLVEPLRTSSRKIGKAQLFALSTTRYQWPTRADDGLQIIKLRLRQTQY